MQIRMQGNKKSFHMTTVSEAMQESSVGGRTAAVPPAITPGNESITMNNNGVNPIKGGFSTEAEKRLTSTSTNIANLPRLNLN